MSAFITPIILFVLSAGIVAGVVRPQIHQIQAQRTIVADLQQTLDRGRETVAQYEQVESDYRSVSADNKSNIEVLLPKNVNNMRLILEVEKLARRNRLGIKDLGVKLDPNQESANSGKTAGDLISGSGLSIVPVNLEVTGEYADFLNLLQELETNLRILNITSIEISAPRSESKQSPSAMSYKLTINTYWYAQPVVTTPVTDASVPATPSNQTTK